MPEFYVCQNHVPAQDWPEPIPREHGGRIRVGWMGSPSHVWDVDLAWPALMYAKQRNADVWMIGYDPVKAVVEDAGGEEHLDRRALDKLRAWQRLGYKSIPWRKPAKYERIPLPLDIGLCPLRTDAMTLGKSDVKALEMWINGACPIASNNSVYNRTVKHMENGLLAGSPSEMIDCVRRLLDDPGLRDHLVEAGQEYVREHRGARQMREEWGYAING